MIVLPNPDKETVNRRVHGLGFDLVSDLLRMPVLVVPDDRPLGPEHEGRQRALGQVHGCVFFLAFQPVEHEDGRAACRPISFRHATRGESRAYWSLYG